eukprot:scaffold5892_cov112-Isochrysis_galbana.AAC.6
MAKDMCGSAVLRLHLVSHALARAGCAPGVCVCVSGGMTASASRRGRGCALASALATTNFSLLCSAHDSKSIRVVPCV